MTMTLHTAVALAEGLRRTDRHTYDEILERIGFERPRDEVATALPFDLATMHDWIRTKGG